MNDSSNRLSTALDTTLSRRAVVAASGTIAAAGLLGAGAAVGATTSLSSTIPDLTAVDLRHAIASRAVSCREVMTAYLDRITHRNPEFNAIVSQRPPEILLVEADAADVALRRDGPRGPLHGFPQAPKDMASTKDIVTTFGSPIFRANLPKEDSLIVERARRSGAILVGKTNVPEFGIGSQSYNPVFGTTRNAWNRDLTSGGSSGGAAVAVAQRLLPVADGSDFMGSLRNPAGWNNVVGFRPSFGLVPMWPADDVFYQQYATEGPIGRTVADAALLLSVQAGSDPRMPLSLDGDPARFAGPLARDFKGTRIGFLADLDGYLPMEAGVLDLCTSALRHFRSIGCTIDVVAPGYDMAKAWESWVTLRSLFTGGRLGPLYDDPALRRQLKPEAVWEIEQGRAATSDRIYRAIATRGEWYGRLHALLAKFDYLILPSAQVFAFPASQHWPPEIAGKAMDTYHRWMEVVVPASLANVPTLSVPAGFDARGRAMGLQIIGKYRDDLAVLQIGHAYEQASGFSGVRPI